MGYLALVECKTCPARQVVTCNCPAGLANAHVGECLMGTAGDPNGKLDCACCPQHGEPGHDHTAAANVCPAGAGQAPGDQHPGTDCPHPGGVAVCDAVTPDEDCPGGHCWPGVEDCTMCRPVRITILQLTGPVGVA